MKDLSMGNRDVVFTDDIIQAESKLSQSPTVLLSNSCSPTSNDVYDIDIDDSPSTNGFRFESWSQNTCVKSQESTELALARRVKGMGTAGKSIEEELCLICGDRASGYHYNALSCEGCKGFFRRSVTRNAIYKCKNGGNCEMDMWMRRRCQACRLRRCREVGMKEECLLTDDQCRARDARRKARIQHIKDMKKEEGSPMAMSPDSNTSGASSPRPENKPVSPEQVLSQLSHEEREIIERLVFYQDKYELPSEDDLLTLTHVRVSCETKPRELNEAIFKQMAEMTVLVTHLVVEFAKRLPGFLNLDREDQIALLKGSSCEVMMIRTARRYDLETDTVVFGNGMPYTRDNMRFAGLHEYTDDMFNFCHKMGKLGVDNAEYALLTAMCIFSERPGLINPQAVEKYQEMYINTLNSYIKFRRYNKGNYFAHILEKLVDLRELSTKYTGVLFNMKIEKGSIPPLLAEYFDVVE